MSLDPTLQVVKDNLLTLIMCADSTPNLSKTALRNLEAVICLPDLLEKLQEAAEICKAYCEEIERNAFVAAFKTLEKERK